MKKRIICVLFLSLAVMISGCTKSEEADNDVQNKDNTIQLESGKETILLKNWLKKAF